MKSWLPVTSTGHNLGDLATLLLLPNVTAEIGLHTHPIGSTAHRYVPIVAPYVTPVRGMKLTMIGAESGLGTVTVTEPDLSRPIGDYTFDNVVVLDRTEHPGEHGDSGASCVWQDPDGNYRMCCIVFAGRAAGGTDHSRINGFAVPASVAEHHLGIKFGVEAPTAKIATPAPVYPGQWFQLDGSRSSVNENGADPLKYLWEKVEVTAQPTPIQPALPPIGPSTSPYHNFEAPTDLGTYAYKLTVTDSNGAKHSDRISVTVVNRPTAAPPVHPSTVSASATSNCVSISWGSVTDATGYDVQIGISGGLSHTDHPTTSTSITIASLSPLQTYEYGVGATNYLGDGPWTN